MKILFPLLSVVLISGSISRAAEPEHPQRIFLLIGQSNMAGRAHLEKGDDAPIGNVRMLDEKGAWIAATNPLNRFATNRKVISMQRVGPGFGFATAMRKALPKTSIGLVVNARGGTKIDEWKKGGKLYDNMFKRVSAVKGIHIDGVLWHQGEANRKDQKYLEKLKVLVATLRKDFKNPNLPFVAGKIYGEGVPNKVYDDLGSNIKHSGVASVKGLKVFDGVHFDRVSQIKLGERYAAEMLKLLKTPSK
jgi:hypothetical protein